MQDLKQSIIKKDKDLYAIFQNEIKQTDDLANILNIYNFKKKADKHYPHYINQDIKTLKIALLGGYTFYPLSQALEVFLMKYSISPSFFVGQYNSYRSEIFLKKNDLVSFDPDIIFVMPSLEEIYELNQNNTLFLDSKNIIDNYVEDILKVCELANKINGAEIILSNFRSDGRHDLGPLRSKLNNSNNNFIHQINLLMGTRSPDYINICDSELISQRLGTLLSSNLQGWFESKQPGSNSFIYSLADEIAYLTHFIYNPMKKVLVIDLDNTCWGGVIGDDGIEGIELGDTSAKGEAYKSFQKYIKSLQNVGIVLAVVSKNEWQVALDVFKYHPEMVLKEKDIVNFKINWNPKSDNIKKISQELNLGLESFVFIDDNPAEIKIVNNFLPEVSTILLDGDPAHFTSKVMEGRYFEPRKITKEDVEKTSYYKREQKRVDLKHSITDIDSYLTSLKMKVKIKNFDDLDKARIVQLGNKSNQFNLTTIRRNDSDIKKIINLKDGNSFVLRVEDCFGDYGLIGVIICEIVDTTYFINTWFMSCRVLERQIENVILNEIIKRGKKNGCKKIVGKYINSNRNNLVKDLYTKLGFTFVENKDLESVYELDITKYKNLEHKIEIIIL